MKTTVTAFLLFEGIHNWPDCDLPSVAYLRSPHRHVFHITCELPVYHSNRDREFICLKKDILDYLSTKHPNGNLGALSCEMIASDLLYVFGLCKCSVFEDGENGATVYAEDTDKANSITVRDEQGKPVAKAYLDPSHLSRRQWEGMEVEGRLKGVPTLFLTTLANAKDTAHPHVFLCPTVVQDEEEDKLEGFVAALIKSGKVVTVAVKPADAHRITPWVRVNAHIMLDIDLHGVTWLKPTDTVKVELAPYTTLSCSVEQMIASNPKDYTQDSTLA